MQGYGGFESWDETYVHHRHNTANRVVLETRQEGDQQEPWTWVRTHGAGRVFYTAWGHDQRTWSNPGFHNLLERGVRWAVGQDPGQAGQYVTAAPFPVPKMTALRTDVAPFEYVEVGSKIPNYTPGARWGTQGEAFSRMQKPLPPEESRKHYVVPEGFRIELFAADPDLGGKPICMNWEERGRLWVAETYDYPNELQPPGQGRDRIRICEDTDGDWRADKFTVFAEQLSIPTSLTFYRGGVIVFDGTRTLYLKDTDGDDVADVRQELFGTWNQGDTHGGPSNMQYGLDNWIWAMQGYNNSALDVGGQTHRFRMGFFRFKPDGSQLEFIRSTDNNTWGLGISEEGIIFGSTANRNPSVYMPIPNRYYEAVRGWTPSLMLNTIADTYLFAPITEKVRQVDQHGGYTAAAGHALYTARRYPQPYWNRTAFVNGPTGHLTGTFVLQPDGSDFRSTSPFNLVASDDEWSAPIMSEVGPDGNMWVLDWYNYIVQHNPTPAGFQTGKGNAYETDLRDKKHGRIYRVVYGEDQQPFSLADATPGQLVDALRHPTMLWRKHAQRLLVERGERDVVPDLLALVENHDVDAVGLNVAAIHALWTLHGLGACDGSDPAVTQALTRALQHPSAGVRRNAVQVLPPTAQSVAAILNADLLQDTDAQVRLLTLLSIADLPSSDEVGPALVNVMKHPDNQRDKWIPDAVVSAAARNSPSFLESVAAGGQAPERLLTLIPVIAEHFARGAPTDQVASVVHRLAAAEPAVAEAVVRGLSAGWPRDARPTLGAAMEEDLQRIADRISLAGRADLLKLAATWGSDRFAKYAAEIAASMVAIVHNEELANAARAAAARQLVEFAGDDPAATSGILDALTPRTPPELAVELLSALQNSQASQTGSQIADQLPSFTPALRNTGLAVLLSRPQWTRALLEAIATGKAQISDLSLDQQRALAEHPDKAIRDQAAQLLAQGGALPNPDRLKVLEQWLPITHITGDPEAGKKVYTEQCAKCHMHSGEGQSIGPDLTGMAVHPKEELLIHLLDPNRSVEGNFRVYTVITVDGRVLNGLLASESRTAIELYDAEGKKQTLLREDIDELVASPKSLMPEGFEKQVNRQQLTDLLEFLTQRGRFLPLDLRKAATITSVRGMFNSRDAAVERLVFQDWSPKTFADVPFHLVNPQDGRVANAILLHGPMGAVCREMPRQVELPVNSPARAIHMLSGVSGWGYPLGEPGSVSMVVRLHYADGQTEDHSLKNGEHFADYIRRVDVPESEFAFGLRGQQLRYLAVVPQRAEVIASIELIKGPDRTSPVVMAITVETQ